MHLTNRIVLAGDLSLSLTHRRYMPQRETNMVATMDKPLTGQSNLSKLGKNRNGKVHTVLHTVPQSEPFTGSYSVSVPQFDEGAERLARANKIVDAFQNQLPEAFRNLLTEEARNAMVSQELEKLPQGTGEAGRREYMKSAIVEVMTDFANQVAGITSIDGAYGARAIWLSTIGIDDDESVKVDVSATGRSVTIRLVGPTKASDGTRTRKASVKPSEATEEQFSEQLPKGIREIADGKTRESYIARWRALVTQTDSFDRLEVQHYLVDNGHWGVNREGNRNWYPQTLGNKTVDKQADIIIAADATAASLLPNSD